MRCVRVAYEVFSGVVTATLSVLCNQCSYVEPQVWTNPARNGLVRILTGYGGVTAATGVRNISSPFPSLFHPGCSQRKPLPLLLVPHSLTLSVCLSPNHLPAGSAHSDSRQGGRARARRGLRHIRLQRRVIGLLTTYLKLHIVL